MKNGFVKSLAKNCLRTYGALASIPFWFQSNKGDAHKLTTYFKEQEKFDLIFSSAVFEHLYMPWVAAMEIEKMLKAGGYVLIEAHFSFASHERPWNFFQFSQIWD
jgi:hypothetical protein